jgi:hypothetical protein
MNIKQLRHDSVSQHPASIKKAYVIGEITLKAAFSQLIIHIPTENYMSDLTLNMKNSNKLSDSRYKKVDQPINYRMFMFGWE